MTVTQLQERLMRHAHLRVQVADEQDTHRSREQREPDSGGHRQGQRGQGGQGSRQSRDSHPCWGEEH